MSKFSCDRCKGEGVIVRKGILGTTETHPCSLCDGTGYSSQKVVGGETRTEHPEPPPGLRKELIDASPHE